MPIVPPDVLVGIVGSVNDAPPQPGPNSTVGAR